MSEFCCAALKGVGGWDAPADVEADVETDTAISLPHKADPFGRLSTAVIGASNRKGLFLLSVHSDLA